MIYINDKEHPLTKEQSIQDLIDLLKLEATRGVAIAINERVIPRKDWATHLLRNNDKIILIKATQGG